MPTLPPHALRAVTHLIARRMGSEEEEADRGRRPSGARQSRRPRQPRRRHAARLCPPAARRPAGAEPDGRDGAGRRRAAGDRRPPRLRPAHGRRRGAPAIGRAKEWAPACWRCATRRISAASAPTPNWRAVAGCAFTAFVNVADHRDVQATWAGGGAAPGHQPVLRRGAGRRTGRRCMLDMATTTIAAGKARVAYNKGVPVPDGCLIDDGGNPTNDPTGFIRDHTGALRVVRHAQGVGPGGDVRDHGRAPSAAGRARVDDAEGRHPELDAGDGHRPVATG